MLFLSIISCLLISLSLDIFFLKVKRFSLEKERYVILMQKINIKIKKIKKIKVTLSGEILSTILFSFLMMPSESL